MRKEFLKSVLFWRTFGGRGIILFLIVFCIFGISQYAHASGTRNSNNGCQPYSCGRHSQSNHNYGDNNHNYDNHNYDYTNYDNGYYSNNNYYPYNYNYDYPYSYTYYLAQPSCTLTSRFSQNYYGSNYYGYNANQTVTLSWNANNTFDAYLSGVGTVPSMGSITLFTYGNRVYTLTVRGLGGSAYCQTFMY